MTTFTRPSDTAALVRCILQFHGFVKKVDAYANANGFTWKKNANELFVFDDRRALLLITFFDASGQRIRGGFGGFEFDHEFERISSSAFVPILDNSVFAFFAELFKIKSAFTTNSFRIFARGF